jgi:hypothetical protein
MEKELLIEVSGDLGDQLFIIASSYAYSKKEDAKLKIIKTTKSNPNYPVYWETLLKKLKPYLLEYYNKDNKDNKDKIWYEKNAVIYEEIKFLNNFMYLNGKMQSYKYFNDYKDDIKMLFKPESLLVNIIRNKYKNLIEQKDRVVVIHSCQKEYETKDYYNTLDSNYYKRSINEFISKKPNPLFLLCIDNEKLCDELKCYINNNEYYILKDDEFLTFTLLQEFNNFIMSNCSFIWWCVWLSNYKHVIVPKNWFKKDDYSNYSNYSNYNNYSDLYYEDWVRID